MSLPSRFASICSVFSLAAVGLLSFDQFFRLPQDSERPRRLQGPPADYNPLVVGRLSVDELMRLFQASFPSPQAGLRTMSGTSLPEATLDQFTRVCQTQHWPVSVSQAMATFQGLDNNQDGKLTLAELLAAFRADGYLESSISVPTVPRPEGLKLASQSDIQSGTPASYAPRFDCSAGLANWRVEWTEEKKRICSLVSRSEMLLYLPQAISGKQVAQLFDVNDDNVIDRKEFVAGATGTHLFTRPLTEPQAEYAFNAMSSDGKLTHQQFIEALGLKTASLEIEPGSVDAKELSKRLVDTYYTLANAFDKLDVDDSHSLVLQEVRSGLARLREPIVETRDADYIFHGLDSLGDGRITPPEFLGTLKLGAFFQSKDAIQKALGWTDKVAQPTHSAVPDSTSKISLSELVKHVSSSFSTSEQAFKSMDPGSTGKASLVAFTNAMLRLRSPLSPQENLWAFHGLDANHDNVVSADEFNDVLGPAMIRVTPSRASDVVDAPVQEQKRPAERIVNANDLKAYRGFPAIVQGEAEVFLQADVVPADIESKVQTIFGQTLSKKLGIHVVIAGVQAVPGSFGGQTLIVLYTSKSNDGASTLQILQNQGKDFETALESALIASLSSSQTLVSSRTSFAFYGPRASKLPAGTKLSIRWGKKPGEGNLSDSEVSAVMAADT